MNKDMQRGSAISSAILSTLLFTTLIFALWAFAGRQSYKNDVDKKIAVAVAADKKVTQAADAQKAAEDAKQPFKEFAGPSTYGSLHVKYPKTWNSYVSTTSGLPANVYFQPDFIPDIANPNTLFALRVIISPNAYSTEVAQFAASTAAVSAYSLPNVPSVVGLKVDGAIVGGKTGSMVLLPLRDKTIELWTESPQYLDDFNNSILPNVTFSP